MVDTQQLEEKLIAQEAYTELIRATTLHGSMRSEHEAYGIIMEELEEWWELAKLNPKKLTADEQNERSANMRKELIQIAAMAMRAVLDTVPPRFVNGEIGRCIE